MWGEGVKIFLARRGSRCGCAQGAPSFYSLDVGRGDIPGAEPEARATPGFRPWRAGRPSFLPPVAGRWVVRARGLDAPAGVLATAAPDRCPRPPGLRRPSRSARLHGVLAAPGPRRPPRNRQTRRLFARGAGAGCPLGRGVRPRASGSAPRPPRLGLRGSQPREFRAPHCSTSGGRGQAGRARGLDCPAQAWTAPQFPHLERNTQGWGTPGRPRSSGFRLCCALRGPRGSGAGRGAGASDAEVVNTARPNWRRSQRAGGHERAPCLRPEKLLSGLCRDHRRPHGRSVETRSLSGSLQSGKLRPGQAWQGMDAASRRAAENRARWGARRRPTAPLAARGCPARSETRVWRCAAERPRHQPRRAARPRPLRETPPLAARTPSGPGREGGSDN